MEAAVSSFDHTRAVAYIFELASPIYRYV